MDVVGRSGNFDICYSHCVWINQCHGSPSRVSVWWKLVKVEGPFKLRIVRREYTDCAKIFRQNSKFSTSHQHSTGFVPLPPYCISFYLLEISEQSRSARCTFNKPGLLSPSFSTNSTSTSGIEYLPYVWAIRFVDGMLSCFNHHKRRLWISGTWSKWRGRWLRVNLLYPRPWKWLGNTGKLLS